MVLSKVTIYMTEIRDTSRDADRRRMRRGRRGMGRGQWGIPLSIRLGGLGERHNLSQRGRKWIWYVLSSTDRISDRQKRQNINCILIN